MQITDGYKNRIMQSMIVALEIIMCLSIYTIVFTVTGKGIPCVFRKVTGMLCPGCGMSHALSSLIHGRISEAIGYNVLSVTICPLIVVFLFVRGIRFVKYGEEEFKALEVLFLLICLIVCTVFFLVRNNLI